MTNRLSNRAVLPAALGLAVVLLMAPLLGASPLVLQDVPDAPPASQDPAPVGSASQQPASPSHEIAARLHLGIDVSSHSGTVEWPQVAEAGHTYAFVKASEGMDLEDPAFDEHWRAMKLAGVVRGAYHFYVTEDDPEAQAKLFIDTVTLEPGDLAPVVDVELLGHGTEPGLAGRLRTFLERLEAHYGIRPIIYTAPNFWDLHLTDDFGDYPLWVAEYGVDEPRLPKGWERWHLWQFEGDTTVSGVEKSADRSHLNRDAPDLHRLVVGE